MCKKHNILIIEDEPDVLSYLEAVFQDNGYDTVSALNGNTGFELAKSQKPDLITLDITMPNQSGMSVYRQFKNDPDLIDTPIVIITATMSSMKGFKEQLVDLPSPEGFVAKPIRVSELLKAISNNLSDR
ncbi:response regulator [Thermodesulfobacteriota bacterium]